MPEPSTDGTDVSKENNVLRNIRLQRNLLPDAAAETTGLQRSDWIAAEGHKRLLSDEELSTIAKTLELTEQEKLDLQEWSVGVHTWWNENSLRKVRLDRGLSQSAAAKKVGVSRTEWAAWETKRRPMRVGDLNAIQGAFSLSNRDISSIRSWWGDQRSRKEQQASA